MRNKLPFVQLTDGGTEETVMPIILWLLGVPLGLVIVLWLLHVI